MPRMPLLPTRYNVVPLEVGKKKERVYIDTTKKDVVYGMVDDATAEADGRVILKEKNFEKKIDAFFTNLDERNRMKTQAADMFSLLEEAEAEDEPSVKKSKDLAGKSTVVEPATPTSGGSVAMELDDAPKAPFKRPAPVQRDDIEFDEDDDKFDRGSYERLPAVEPVIAGLGDEGQGLGADVEANERLAPKINKNVKVAFMLEGAADLMAAVAEGRQLERLSSSQKSAINKLLTASGQYERSREVMETLGAGRPEAIRELGGVFRLEDWGKFQTAVASGWNPALVSIEDLTQTQRRWLVDNPLVRNMAFGVLSAVSYGEDNFSPSVLALAQSTINVMSTDLPDISNLAETFRDYVKAKKRGNDNAPDLLRKFRAGRKTLTKVIEYAMFHNTNKPGGVMRLRGKLTKEEKTVARRRRVAAKVAVVENDADAALNKMTQAAKKSSAAAADQEARRALADIGSGEMPMLLAPPEGPAEPLANVIERMQERPDVPDAVKGLADRLGNQEDQAATAVQIHNALNASGAAADLQVALERVAANDVVENALERDRWNTRDAIVFNQAAIDTLLAQIKDLTFEEQVVATQDVALLTTEVADLAEEQPEIIRGDVEQLQNPDSVKKVMVYFDQLRALLPTKLRFIELTTSTHKKSKDIVYKLEPGPTAATIKTKAILRMAYVKDLCTRPIEAATMIQYIAARLVSLLIQHQVTKTGRGGRDNRVVRAELVGDGFMPNDVDFAALEYGELPNVGGEIIPKVTGLHDFWIQKFRNLVDNAPAQSYASATAGAAMDE